MQVVNAVEPTPAQIQALVAEAPSGPIQMLNLLKFRAEADYGPGANEPKMSGQAAYMRYGVEVQKLVGAGGGRVLYQGMAQRMVIGEVGEAWDAVAVVEYASAAAFVQMALSDEMRKIMHHRKAGLEGQLLIMCTAGVG
jgi:uncharacterized protein (DUF1330 family)